MRYITTLNYCYSLNNVWEGAVLSREHISIIAGNEKSLYCGCIFACFRFSQNIYPLNQKKKYRWTTIKKKKQCQEFSRTAKQRKKEKENSCLYLSNVKT